MKPDPTWLEEKLRDPAWARAFGREEGRHEAYEKVAAWLRAEDGAQTLLTGLPASDDRVVAAIVALGLASDVVANRLEPK